MPYARTQDGVRIYYEQHGRGTPLVLAYGIGGNADMWDVNREALAGHHRLVLWEPPGHARSDSPQDAARYSFPHWVLDLKSRAAQSSRAAPGSPPVCPPPPGRPRWGRRWGPPP